MTTETQHLQDEIGQTQASIRENLTELQERINPKSAVKRRASRVGDTIERAGRAVMGTAQEGASQAEAAATAVPDQVRDRTRGNPLAMGLLAFSAGWLVSSLIPASRLERRTAATAKHKAAEASEPLRESAKDVARTIGEEARETGHALQEEVRESASALAASARRPDASTSAAI